MKRPPSSGEAPNGPQGVVGGASGGNVQPLRRLDPVMQGAYQEALERLLEAMCLTASINDTAAAAYAVLFRTCEVTAPFGEHGEHTVKILRGLDRRLRAHLAGGSHKPDPDAA